MYQPSLPEVTNVRQIQLDPTELMLRFANA